MPSTSVSVSAWRKNAPLNLRSRARLKPMNPTSAPSAFGANVGVAHWLGKRHPCAHKLPECLDGNFAKKPIRKGKDAGKTKHEVWLNKYDTLLKRAHSGTFVAHHKEKYGGCLPVWVAIEVWDFGLLSHLFECMKNEDQRAIAVQYGAKDGRVFAQWLRSLNFIRNVSAHHSRLWNINIPWRTTDGAQIAPKGEPELSVLTEGV